MARGPPIGMKIVSSRSHGQKSCSVNYNPTKYIRIRPEVSYDFQSGNAGSAYAFGWANTTGKTSTCQVTVSVDMVVWF
jgi:hypothetical protein